MKTLLACVGTLALAGCAMRPQYNPPVTQAPPAYKEQGNWKPAGPADQIPRGKWWEIYQDPQLNALEEQIAVSNQTLKAAQAQFEQARAVLRINRSLFYPTVTGATSISRIRESSNRPNHSATSKDNFGDFVLSADATYEADVWGRVRGIVASSRAGAQASAADLEAVSLSLHAELAFDYFALRGLDTEKQLLESTVTAYERALQLTDSRYKGGLASGVDVAQAQTQLETTRAQAQDVQIARAQLEHAIAVLTGQAPAGLNIPVSPLSVPPPAIPAGLPSELLERRPDIAAAERRLAAANAQIGVARAAFFPVLTLSAAAGLESTRLTTWLSGPSGLLAAGSPAVITAFDAGRRRAISDQARAAYDRTAADYRETVLSAFAEVEDSLAALRILEGEARTQDAAVTAAARSLTLSETRYKGGVANYLEVTTAQSAALADQRAAVSVLTRRLTSSVLLIKALGGGWNVSQLPQVGGGS